MELLNKTLQNKEEITYGDILVFSDVAAFLIVEDGEQCMALQLLNNGNENLRYIEYSNLEIKDLVDRLFCIYGQPIKITNIYEVEIKL